MAAGPRLEGFGLVLCALGVFFALVGIAAGSKLTVAAATFMTGVGYFVRDYGRRSPAELDAMSVYMLAAGVWYGLANFIGFWAIGTPFNTLFPIWRVDEFLDRAQTVAAVGVLGPPIGYWLAAQMRDVVRLPTVGFDISDRALLRFAAACIGATWACRVGDISLAGFGLFGALANNGVNFAVFILSTISATRGTRDRTVWKLAFTGVLGAEVMYQLAYSYLRIDAVFPLVALLMPYVIRKRVGARIAVVTAAIALVFALILKPLADLRQTGVDGRERLAALAEVTGTRSSDVREGVIALVARLSTFSQLSQICRIVRDEGHTNGETMAYVIFAFVPRAIWPSKPEITPGQWFAEKLGRGQRLSARRFSNAINMTIPGELFLNFAWVGAGLGTIVLGLLFGLLWDSVSRGLTRNPVALIFGYVVFVQAMLPAAHFGSMLNLMLWYLLSLFLTVFASSLLGWSAQTLTSARAQRAGNAERGAGLLPS